jgi:DNA-binding CsgD family transcriptional regulator
MADHEQLKSLPMRERKALELRLSGATIKQIAAALRISEYAATKLIGAARRRLDTPNKGVATKKL